MGSASATNGPGAKRSGGGHHVPRQRGHGKRSAQARRRGPDLAVVAKEAVVTYLFEASEATAEAGDGEAPEAGPQAAMAGLLADQDASAAQDVAVRAAAVSVATLDRIEAAAARLEADIAAARIEQAELRAGAGKAAAEAIHAAQRAWTAAGSAEAASSRTRRMARLVLGYLVIAGILALIQLVILVIFASSAH